VINTDDRADDAGLDQKSAYRTITRLKHSYMYTNYRQISTSIYLMWKPTYLARAKRTETW